MASNKSIRSWPVPPKQEKKKQKTQTKLSQKMDLSPI